MTRRLARYAMFVRHRQANGWLACGWMPDPCLDGCYHGQFAVLMLWICDCEMRRPGKDNVNG